MKLKPLLLLTVSLVAFAAPPTFNKDIAPILYRHCATCHRPGEVAPFPLLTYDDAAKRAALIATVTRDRQMPPWKAEPGYGSFSDERRLSSDEIALLQAWAKNGVSEGQAKDKPATPVFSEGWQAGQPDEVLTMPHKSEIAADGPDEFRCFVLPRSANRDIFVRGIEFRPGNRRIVHHALIFLDSSGRARKLAAASADSGYSCFGGPGFPPAGIIGGWAPGVNPTLDLSAWSTPIPKGDDIVLQIHYHPSGKAEDDQSKLGLTYSSAPTAGRTNILLFSRKIDIAPGNSNFVVKASLTVPQDVDLIGIAPHAHYLGKNLKVEATLPDGSVKPLIWIKDWDFNWQGQYRYATPIHLPKGTKVSLQYLYDNSAANPRNPSNPPVRVTWGEQTKNEMAIAFLAVILPSTADVAPFRKAMRMQYLQEFLSADLNIKDLPLGLQGPDTERLKYAFQLFDKNGDGVLDQQERAALLQFLHRRMN